MDDGGEHRDWSGCHRRGVAERGEVAVAMNAENRSWVLLAARSSGAAPGHGERISGETMGCVPCLRCKQGIPPEIFRRR